MTRFMAVWFSLGRKGWADSAGRVTVPGQAGRAGLDGEVGAGGRDLLCG